MLVADFNYNLPEGLIAQEPPPDRVSSRLLHLTRATGRTEDRTFSDFPDLLRPDDRQFYAVETVLPDGGQQVEQVAVDAGCPNESIDSELHVVRDSPIWSRMDVITTGQIVLPQIPSVRY